MEAEEDSNDAEHKVIIYQVFTRLFGNKSSANHSWGTIEENGSGKFADFTHKSLAEIRSLGATHIWYTGVPHHASVTDYSEFGITADDPDVVKGRAGSPYAVRDYYNVDPDLAVDPGHRLQEFEALIERSHHAGLKVIIDIVPNHVARRYTSETRPDLAFGLNDNTDVAFDANNNFYYLPGQPFEVPDFTAPTRPLGGESHPEADGQFDEYPARWTGNSARRAQPDVNDWYETVKINYGVSPDGQQQFPSLPESLWNNADISQHIHFWQDKSVPDSWVKFRDIARYWLDKGVDGFRYDMAEMVPVAFWSYLNSSIKAKNSDTLLLAEVYQPDLYRNYLHVGKMDFLYDKVDFYDSLKLIMQGKEDVVVLNSIQNKFQDISGNLLHFLENHDEQRLASPDFAGSAEKGKPALVVSSLISTSPMMIYFGQEVGEDASEALGFGQPTRTSIFDYGGVPAHQRWMNNGLFDGGQLTQQEEQLRNYYVSVLNIARQHPAVVNGDYVSLLDSIRVDDRTEHGRVFAFARQFKQSQLISVSNFYNEKAVDVTLTLPDCLQTGGEKSKAVRLKDLLTQSEIIAVADGDTWIVSLKLEPLQSVILSN